MLSPLLKRYTWNSAWLYYARIFIALCGTTAFPWWLGDVKLTIPLTLGMVAAALTDLDDRLAGRLRNLIITLFCFFIASASVELLFPWPWLFAIGLTLSTSGFILLGGLGQRYATIAFGALPPFTLCWEHHCMSTGISSQCIFWPVPSGTTS